MQSPHRAVVAPRKLPLQEPSFCTEKAGRGGRGSQHRIAQNHGPLELAGGAGTRGWGDPVEPSCFIGEATE